MSTEDYTIGNHYIPTRELPKEKELREDVGGMLYYRCPYCGENSPHLWHKYCPVCGGKFAS